MSMHTYIGARYVPRFTGVYDPTQSYEALDVVDNGSGTSYIARKTVPAGTPLTDTTCWFLYGASSGAIVALQNDMIQAQNDILALQALTPELERLTDRAYILISDSYGGMTNSDGDSFFDVFQNALNLDADHFYSAYVGSSRFYSTNPVTKFLTVLQSVTPTDADMITDIVVIGGANDAAQTYSDTRTAMAEFMTYVRSTYPNAKVSLFTCGLTFTTAGMTNVLTNMIPAWTQSQDLGFYHIANSEYVLRNTAILDGSDYCHPNASGVDAIAQGLINWACGNGVDVHYLLKLADTYSMQDSGGTALVVTTLSNNCHMERNNGSVSLGFGNARAVSFRKSDSTPFSISAGGSLKLIFPSTLYTGRNDIFENVFVPLFDKTTNKMYPALLYMNAAVGSIVGTIIIPGGIPGADNATELSLLLNISAAM